MRLKALSAALAALLFAQPLLAAELSADVPSVPDAAGPAPVAALPALGPAAALDAASLDAGPLPGSPAALPEGPAAAPALPAAAAAPALPAAAPVSGAPGRPAAAAQAARLAAAKDPQGAGSSLFDGLASGDAPGGAPAVPEGSRPPDPPRLGRPSRAARAARYLRDLNAATGHSSPSERRFERFVEAGLAAGLLAPFLARAVPFMTLATRTPVSLTLMVAAFGGITLWRAGRFLLAGKAARPPAPGAASRRRAAWTGAALGLALALAPVVFQGPLSVREQNAVEPGAHVVAVPGGTLARVTQEELAKNPVGRDVLRGLEDRFGVVHMPRFYLGDTGDAVARYNDLVDGVTVDKGAALPRGVTVEQFLASPRLQAKFARDNAELLAHELRHADQARRSIFEDGVVRHRMNVESEDEAYLTQHDYVFAELQADPHAVLSSDEFGDFLAPIDDFDGFLRETAAAYPKDVHVHSAYFQAYFAKRRAQWPAHQVECYLLLARRNSEHPAVARGYLQRARAVAAAHGLPIPQNPLK